MQNDNSTVSNSWKYFQPVFKVGKLTVSGIISNHKISHFDHAFLLGKTNLMASSADGNLIFLVMSNCINVYKSAEFSSKNPPDPSSFFPFAPLKVLRPTPQQLRKIITNHSIDDFCFNHIRSGWISNIQESLIAVGEFGAILIWNIQCLDDEPIMLESNDLASTWGIAMSPNNFLVATSSNSHAVTIFHFPTRRVIFSVEQQHETSVHSHNIPSLDFSPCGRFLASCSIEGNLALWSIEELFVIKLTPFSCKEWGWLVRFIPQNQYDAQINLDTRVRKSFYHSKVEELPQIYLHDLDDESYRNTQSVLERMMILTEELDVFGTFGEDTESSNEILSNNNDDSLSENSNSSDSDSNSDLSSPSKQVRLSYSENDTLPLETLRILPVSNSDDVHLAENAGDTWPDSEDYSEDEGYNQYEYVNSDEFFSNSDSLEIKEYDNNSDNKSECDYHSEVGHTDDSKSDFGDYNIHSDFILCASKFYLTGIDNLQLFRSNDIQATCPYDIVYCTSSSVFIINPVNGQVKLAVPDFVQNCFENQNEDDGNRSFLGIQELFVRSLLQNRLGMGEWIPELGVFIIINSNGHLITISPTTTPSSPDSLQSNTIMLPNIPFLSTEAIAYTVIRKRDEEFGIKIHVYIICEDGTFRLYEIVKE